MFVICSIAFHYLVKEFTTAWRNSPYILLVHVMYEDNGAHKHLTSPLQFQTRIQTPSSSSFRNIALRKFKVVLNKHKGKE